MPAALDAGAQMVGSAHLRRIARPHHSILSPHQPRPPTAISRFQYTALKLQWVDRLVVKGAQIGG